MVIISIEKHIVKTISFDSEIDEFASIKPRKLPLKYCNKLKFVEMNLKLSNTIVKQMTRF